jgi:hypothetical protein
MFYLMLTLLTIALLYYMTFTILLFTLTPHGRVPVSPLIPHNTKIIKRVFNKRARYEERFCRFGRRFTVGLLALTAACWPTGLKQPSSTANLAYFNGRLNNLTAPKFKVT